MNEAVVKRAQPSDIEALGILSDRVFRPKQTPGTAMPKEFPLMFGDDNAEHLYFAEVDGQPVSLVGIRPGAVHVHGVCVSVISMGSVCTLPEYRQNHFASCIVERVIREYESTTSLLLVSGNLPIYRRVGCVDFGDWLSVALNPIENPSHHHFLIESGPVDVDELEAIYRSEPLRFARTRAEMETLLQSMSTPEFRAQSTPPCLLVAREQGRAVAYAIGLCVDHEPGSVHLVEWAGARTAIPLLADQVRQHFNARRAHLFVAPTDYTLRSWLQGFSATWSTVPNQGTVRVLNPGRLLQEMSRLIEEMVGADVVVEARENDGWAVCSPSQGHRILADIGELSEWLFSSKSLGLPLARTDDLNYI